MKTVETLTIAIMTVVLMLTGVGCNGDAATSDTSDVETSPPPATVEGAHAHPTHGPHGGDLIELGNEEYHAELVHSEGEEIVIYILGSDAKTAVPIEATEVVVNVVHDGNPEQFKLNASTNEGDPKGQSSRFSSSEAELSEHVHEEGAAAKLVVLIDGKQYTGKIAHDHDHDHGHAHD
jgi:hypothetical protein